MSVISNLLSNINSVLGVRDSLGANLKTVKIVTKTWTGTELGDGTANTVKVTMSPSPRIVAFEFDRKLPEGGSIKQGDIMLKMVSKQTYPNESDVDCKASAPNIEKYYEVGGVNYEVIGVREKHVVWNIHLRRMSYQG